MKQLLTLLSLLIFSSSLFAQYKSEDLLAHPEGWNPYLNPQETPIKLPVYGFIRALEEHDHIRIQVADKNKTDRWLEDEKVIFSKDSQQNLTQFAIFQWDASAGDWNANVNYTVTYIYDSLKRAQEFARLDSTRWFKEKIAVKYIYNKKGQVLAGNQITSSYNNRTSSWDNSEWKEAYTYDNSGQLIEKTLSITDGNDTMPAVRWRLSYDTQGNCIEAYTDIYEETNSVWEQYQRLAYGYNSSNRMKRFTYYDWNGAMWEAYIQKEYRYNNYDQVVWVETLEVESDTGEASSYSYHSDGRLDYSISHMRTSSTASWEEQEKTGWVYTTSNSELLYAYVYASDGGDWEKQPHTRILYSENEPIVTPKAPAKLEVKNTSDKDNLRLYLSWDDRSDNEDGFVVYRSQNATDFIRIDSVTADQNWYEDQNLDSTKYYYQISAYNDAGESSFSNIASDVTFVGMPRIEKEDWTLTVTKTSVQVQSQQLVEGLFITDITGRNIGNATPYNGFATLDIEDLRKGLYVVTVVIDGTLSSKKIWIP